VRAAVIDREGIKVVVELCFAVSVLTEMEPRVDMTTAVGPLVLHWSRTMMIVRARVTSVSGRTIPMKILNPTYTTT
jgi:hypothetical protein